MTRVLYEAYNINRTKSIIFALRLPFDSTSSIGGFNNEQVI